MNKNALSASAVKLSEYRSRNAWGLLAAINLYDCDHEMIQDPKAIKKFISGLCKTIKMVRKGETMVEKFGEGKLEGYSAIQFIETSTVVAHFDDKTGDRAFIDIFSCKFFEQEKAAKYCQKFFKAKKYTIKNIVRE